MTASESGAGYLNPDAKLYEEKGLQDIRVERREDGYHITLLDKDSVWTRNEDIGDDMVPVASITEAVTG